MLFVFARTQHSTTGVTSENKSSMPTHSPGHILYVQIADFKFSGQQKAYRLSFPRHAEHLALEQTVRHYNLRQPTKTVFLTADKQAGFQKFALLFCRQRHILPPCRLFIPYKLLLKKIIPRIPDIVNQIFTIRNTSDLKPPLDRVSKTQYDEYIA